MCERQGISNYSGRMEKFVYMMNEIQNQDQDIRGCIFQMIGLGGVLRRFWEYGAYAQYRN